MDQLNTAHGVVHVCNAQAELADGAAREFIEICQAAIAQRKQATIALSGGSTPKVLYARLLQPDLRNTLDWNAVHFFISDERSVPKDSSDSNWGNAWRLFLNQLNLPTENLHPLHGEDKYPAQSAAGYEAEIRNFFEVASDAIPSFDLILLGMGPDGHCASLFPESPALKITDRLVVENRVEKLNTTRITFTFPLINQAHNVVFLVEGESKSKVLAEALTSSTDNYPVQRIRPKNGQVQWWTDAPAARDLLTARK